MRLSDQKKGAAIGRSRPATGLSRNADGMCYDTTGAGWFAVMIQMVYEHR